MLGLGERVLEPEVMDSPDLDPALHAVALSALGRINRLSNSVAIAYDPIRTAVRRDPNRRWRVLDVACGGGDIAAGLARRARRDGLNLDVHGCDMSPRAVTFSQQLAARSGLPVHFFQHDIAQQGIPPGYDVVVNSLFLHHLSWDDAVAFLTNTRREARSMVIVQDLIRCPAGYVLADFARRVLSRSPVVYNDAVQSVRAAFTLEEVRRLLNAAKCSDAQLSLHWPCRFRLVLTATESNRDDGIA